MFRLIILSVLVFQIPLGVKAQDVPLKILSYNVLKGLQGDTANMSRYVTWVKGKAPDIIFYQEMNGFTQKSLETFALHYGHPYAVLAKESGYSVAITSRFPIVNVQKVLDNMWHGYIYANIHGIHVFAVHLSPFVYQKRLYEVKEVLAHAATLPKGSPVIIAGDFNSYHSKDSLNYTAKDLAAQRKREQGNAEIRNLNNGHFDYSVLDEIERSGFKDAVDLVSDQFNYTMPTKKYDAAFKTKIRIDYIWLNSILKKKVSEAAVIYDQHTEQMSDHYPVLLKLKR
ncbi:endonuclease/exonuclease/phosphatase family protein [Pedobacter metabolipauper]|uniref:Exonuclease III n=1 Tax=Pedobacter metabolipauper TaxID=425513 RepID=A0A4R6SZK3_9SPHI|nr:endonuclease/exonuclease/phosphatase family protein [Pedobacter metabolipauper]TDQ11517.1 exonuclease III [Pedobacter metabolipauper]